MGKYGTLMGQREKNHRSTFPPLTEKYRTRRRCHLLLHRLWVACTKEQEACVFFNWKRISFKNRNKTEPVQWYVCVAVRENYGEKKIEKNASEFNSSSCIKPTCNRLTCSKSQFQLYSINFWFHLAFIFIVVN